MSKDWQKECNRIAQGLQKDVKSSANDVKRMSDGLQKDCERIAKGLQKDVKRIAKGFAKG